MKSIGETLMFTREQMGFTLEEASKNTNISRDYLDALENEEFDKLPGETYLIGFLRNYAGFLGLSGDEIVQRYHNIKIQEQPLPMVELLKKKPKWPKKVLIGSIIALGIGGILTLYYTGALEQLRQARAEQVARAQLQSSRRQESYEMTDVILEREFPEGAQLRIPLEDTFFSIEIAEIGASVQINTEGSIVRVRPDQQQLIDINDDGQGDINVLVRSINRESSPPYTIIRFDRAIESPDGINLTTADLPAIKAGSTNIATRVRQPRVVAQISRNSQTFPVQIDIETSTILHYQVDSQERQGSFFEAAQTIRLQPRQEIRLWVANAGAISVRINQSRADIGAPGEVATVIIRRSPDEINEPNILQLAQLY